MTFVSTGLGQLYNGQPAKFLFLQFAVPTTLLLVLWFVIALPIAPLNVLSLAALPVMMLAIARDALRHARARRDGPREWFSRWPSCLAAFLIGAVVSDQFQEFVRESWIQAVTNPSASMAPAILPGDRLFLDKSCYGLRMPYIDLVLRPRLPERGDVVMLLSPHDGKRMLKRVIGLPGESVESRDHVVSIGGRVLPESYASVTRPSGGEAMSNWGPVTVPPDQVLVLGDSRNNSFDSRYFGFVRASAVKGKAAIIYFSWDDEARRPRWDRIGALVR